MKERCTMTCVGGNAGLKVPERTLLRQLLQALAEDLDECPCLGEVDLFDTSEGMIFQGQIPKELRGLFALAGKFLETYGKESPYFQNIFGILRIATMEHRGFRNPVAIDSKGYVWEIVGAE